MGLMGRRLMAVLLILVLFALVPGTAFDNCASAATANEQTYLKPKMGKINVPANVADALNARADASSSSALVAPIPNGTIVELLGTKKYSNGKLWYKIRFNNNGTQTEAYGFADYIQIYTPKPANETYASPRPAYVDYSPETNVRSGPGQNYAMVKDKNGQNVTLNNGTRVEALAYQNGYYKCNIMIDGEQKVGWLYADFVRLYTTPAGDEEFVAQMKAQGFPDSYIESLRILHAQHPNWVFIADKTGLDWNASVDAESQFGKSLVYYTSPTSWKWVDDLSYTFKNADNVDGGFKGLDGKYWHAANRTATAYFMDPRNFLTESEVFQFETADYDEQIHTLERVQALLEGTFMAGDIPGEYMWTSQTVNRNEKGKIISVDTVEATSGTPLTYAYVILESAKISGVNPDMLVARIIQEMGSEGTSLIISGKHSKYPGLYNYYDFDTYADGKTDAITKGLFYASRSADVAKSASNYLASAKETVRPWNKRWKALYGGAILVGREYKEKGQDTLYFQKFNVSSAVSAGNKYTHQYMTNIQAPANEARTMWKACPDLDTAMTFKIPVYENMSDTPAPYPGGGSKANPNPYLASLEVEGCSLTPGFDYRQLTYDVNVSAETASVKVNAVPLATTTSVGSGTVQLQPGLNEIKVLSTAAYGNSVTYVLNIYRELPGENPEVNPTIPNNNPDPNAGTTDPNAGTTDPNAGTTDPNAGTTDPNAGTTDPNAGTTDPNAGTTDPNAGTTDPNAGTTDPNAGTTDPNAGTTDPNAGTTDPNAGTANPVETVEHIRTIYVLSEDGYITGVDPSTTAAAFKTHFKVDEGGEVTILNPDGTAVADDAVIGTGYKICTPKHQFVVVIYGDVNKDGLISIYDLLYIKRSMLNMIQLDDAAFRGANVKTDSVADIYDMLYIKRHMIGVSLLEQPKTAETVY